MHFFYFSFFYVASIRNLGLGEEIKIDFLYAAYHDVSSWILGKRRKKEENMDVKCQIKGVVSKNKEVFDREINA